MIPFIDLAAQQKRIRPQIEAALLHILDHGAYIMGPEIDKLESQLSAFCGAQHTLTCSNGTDALDIVLMAKNVGPGDAIFVPSFTFAATAEVVAWAGATVIFVDVLKDTYNLDPESLEKGIKVAKELGLRPYGVIPVDLFGQAADYDAIHAVAEKEGLWVLTILPRASVGPISDEGGNTSRGNHNKLFPSKAPRMLWGWRRYIWRIKIFTKP